MKRFFLLVMSIVSVTYSAKSQQVIYDENAEVRSVGKFTGIEVSGTISLYLSQGNETGVAVSAGDAKYNSKIKTEVKNGVLQISVDAGMWNGFSWTNKKLKAYVSVVDLNRLEISGASYATISGNLQTNALKVDISGASEVKGSIQVNNLNLDISGASVTRLTGTSKTLHIDASGACRVNGFDLKADNAKVDASGASHITLSVNKELSANASGGSSIQYRGEPTVTNLNSSTGASIKRKNSGD
ncbi:MAG TPA: head GIN domain-containing protein [Segetibacter sp.]|jgi:hypothetical protein